MKVFPGIIKISLPAILFLLIFSACNLLAAPIQWKSSEGGNNNWYDVYFKTLRWDVAKIKAEEHYYNGIQGHLATITSLEEQNWLWSELPYCKKWLGGYQADNTNEPDKGWAWITGEKWEYTNWKAGEPNDNFGEEDWLVFSGICTGVWNDQMFDGCNKITGYFVEYESEPVPEPTGFLLLFTGLACIAADGRLPWKK